MDKTSWQEMAIRNRFLDAAEVLLADRSLAKLSISDLCAQAQVSRQTFYRYFEDKYDLAQWHFTHIVAKPLIEIGRTLNWYDATLAAVNEIVARKVLYVAAYQQSRGYQSISAFGHRSIRDILTETIVEYRGIELTDDLEFQIRYHAEATLNVFTNWGRKGMQTPPEDFTRRLCQCIPYDLFNLLNEPITQASDPSRGQSSQAS